MRIVAAFVIFALAAAASFALGLPMAEETPTADAARQPAAEAVADRKEIPIEERLPPGFKVKKRGKFTLFCKTDTPLGTRFKSETCYDEPNLRAYMLARQENKSDVDRIRNICSNPCACGQPEAC
jgi:hypothetical protein